MDNVQMLLGLSAMALGRDDMLNILKEKIQKYELNPTDDNWHELSVASSVIIIKSIVGNDIKKVMEMSEKAELMRGVLRAVRGGN